MIDLIWLIFIILLFEYFWRQRKYVVQAQNWQLTTGKIMKFQLPDVNRWPLIEYSYQVNEHNFDNETLFLLDFYRPNSRYAREVMYRLALAYKEDEMVDVFYNPANPEEATLDRSIPDKLNFIIIFLSILFGGHLIYCLIKYFSGH